MRRICFCYTLNPWTKCCEEIRWCNFIHIFWHFREFMVLQLGNLWVKMWQILDPFFVFVLFLSCQVKMTPALMTLYLFQNSYWGNLTRKCHGKTRTAPTQTQKKTNPVRVDGVTQSCIIQATFDIFCPDAFSASDASSDDQPLIKLKTASAPAEKPEKTTSSRSNGTNKKNSGRYITCHVEITTSFGCISSYFLLYLFSCFRGELRLWQRAFDKNSKTVLQSREETSLSASKTISSYKEERYQYFMYSIFIIIFY